MLTAQLDTLRSTAPPIDVVEIQPGPRIVLAEPFPQVSACKFCGSCIGCEHLVAVLVLDGRCIPLYGPGLAETRRLVTQALAPLLMT